MKNRHMARELAVQTLYAMDFNNELDRAHIPETFSGLSQEEFDALDPEVKIFGRYLVEGTIDHLPEIDSLISQYSLNRPIGRIDTVDRNILRMSVFCFLYDKDIHPNIVIDEAVKISQEFSTEVTYKFINGILDAMARKMGLEGKGNTKA